MIKTQTIRLIDVFVLGPCMIKGSQCNGMNDNVKAILLWGGIATIIFNAGNYLAIQNGTTTLSAGP